MRTGATVEKTYNNGARLNDIELDKANVQFLYYDGEKYHFMNTETFEQIELGPEIMEDVKDYLVENAVVSLESYEGEPLAIKLPTAVDLRVVWAEAISLGASLDGWLPFWREDLRAYGETVTLNDPGWAVGLHLAAHIAW